MAPRAHPADPHTLPLGRRQRALLAVPREVTAELSGQEPQGRLNQGSQRHGLAAAAIEDPMALGIRRLDPTGMDIDRQLADVAAGRRGGHHQKAGDTRIRPRL